MTDLDQRVILKWQVSERREDGEMRSKEDRKAKVWKSMLSRFIKNSILGFTGGYWDTGQQKAIIQCDKVIWKLIKQWYTERHRISQMYHRLSTQTSLRLIAPVFFRGKSHVPRN